jgi:hypothetical protein|tara:strand:- start:311 stop:751 length:441 start_codon:yes stop_codon:yes gene_type:complete
VLLKILVLTPKKVRQNRPSLSEKARHSISKPQGLQRLWAAHDENVAFKSLPLRISNQQSEILPFCDGYKHFLAGLYGKVLCYPCVNLVSIQRYAIATLKFMTFSSNKQVVPLGTSTPFVESNFNCTATTIENGLGLPSASTTTSGD